MSHEKSTGTVVQAADIAGVNPSTIRRWIKDGHLAAVRKGPSRIRVDLDALDELLAPLSTAPIALRHNT
jgi:excisionase family DNA binding protein